MNENLVITLGIGLDPKKDASWRSYALASWSEREWQDLRYTTVSRWHRKRDIGIEGE